MRTSIKLMGLTLVLGSATVMAENNMANYSSISSISSHSSVNSLTVSSVMKERETKDVDNTHLNTRDKSGNTLTAQKQSNSESDREILAAVRRAIVDDENLSITAQNVKVIAVKGVITLRGPVKNMNEKLRIEELARNVAGVRSIDNQLDVNTN